MDNTAETILVPQQPRLAVEFARAAITSGGRRGLAGALPNTRLHLPAVRIDRDNLIAYQQLCKFPVNDLLPPTYPHLLGFPLQVRLMAAAEFPLPLPGLLHLHNEIIHREPLHAEHRPDVTVHAENLRPHHRGVVVDLVTLVGVEGRTVWSSRSTYLHLHRSRDQAGEARTDDAELPRVPDAPPSAEWRLGPGLGRAYAAVSGDVNPIHLHRLTASLFGFAGPIAHGMWSVARVLAALGPKARRSHTSRVWFRRPIVLPTRVALIHDHSASTAALVAAHNREKVHLLLTLASD